MCYHVQKYHDFRGRTGGELGDEDLKLAPLFRSSCDDNQSERRDNCRHIEGAPHMLRMMRMILKSITMVLFSGSLLLVVFLATALSLLANGSVLPSRLYMLLGDSSENVSLVSLVVKGDNLLSPSPNIEASRDLAFQMLNVKPETRQWMAELPIELGSDKQLAGWYDPRDSSIVISEPYVQVFLHEYAHANFDRKPLWERCSFVIALGRLFFDGTRYVAAHQVLSATLALAAHQARLGQSFDLVQEAYAFIAQSSYGDLNAIPPYLQNYYADYLQSGKNG